MVITICDLTSKGFDHLDITSLVEVDQRVVYTQTILRGSAINKYKTVLLECKQLVKNLMGDKWTLGDLKAISTEDFWDWVNSDGLAYNGDASYLG